MEYIPDSNVKNIKIESTKSNTSTADDTSSTSDFGSDTDLQHNEST
jgi:hypothetical protein